MVNDIHTCPEQEAEDENKQDIRIVYMDEVGFWFLWFDYPNGSNCIIEYCPWCSVKLQDLMY